MLACAHFISIKKLGKGTREPSLLHVVYLVYVAAILVAY